MLPSKLRQLHHRVETSYRLLIEALEQQQKFQRDIDSLARSVEASVDRPNCDWWDAKWENDDVLVVEQLVRDEHQRDELRVKLLDDKEEVEACIRSYGISSCREIGQYMFERMPRELRDIVYHEIDQDSHSHAGRQYHDDKNDENSVPSLLQRIRKDQEDKYTKLSSPLDYRFMLFEQHYFQTSYMGSSSVRELVDIHFRATPFKVWLEELYSKRGHRDFFLVDKYGLGFSLGRFLSRVEIITSLDHSRIERLQPLMAISNTECIIELTSPGPLVTSDDFGRNDLIASAETFLERIAVNLRRMNLKGYCVRVRYQEKLIYVANEKDEKKTGEAFHIDSRSKILSTLTKRKTGTLSQTSARLAKQHSNSTLRSREATPTLNGLVFGQHLTLDHSDHDHRQASQDESSRSVSDVPKHCPVNLDPASVSTTVHEALSQSNNASAALVNNTSSSITLGSTPQLSADVVPRQSNVESREATPMSSLRRQNDDGESLDDIRAFYENRRAEVRAFFESCRK